jgi:hypothetical protein
VRIVFKFEANISFHLNFFNIMKNVLQSVLVAVLATMLGVLNAQTSAPLMRDFIGVNVKSQLPAQKMSRVGYARNFHLWADDQGDPTGGGNRLSV